MANEIKELQPVLFLRILNALNDVKDAFII